MAAGRTSLKFLLILAALSFPFAESLECRSPVSRAVPNQYYPQRPTGELRLNYYYDRTGRWVKFSDWIPFRQRKFVPVFFEDFYSLYHLPAGYMPADVKESIYYLYAAMGSKFRHPRQALCRIDTEEEYHKYRLLMFMETNLIIMRMYLRLGSLYDVSPLKFHTLDQADDLEVSFLAARTYYSEAQKYWAEALRNAKEANGYRFELDLPTIESHRFEMVEGKLDFQRIIDRHLARVEAKLDTTAAFLEQEGRPRPVKKAMLDDVSKIYDERFPSDPLTPPVMNPEWKEKPLFDDTDQIFAPLDKPLEPMR